MPRRATPALLITTIVIDREEPSGDQFTTRAARQIHLRSARDFWNFTRVPL